MIALCVGLVLGALVMAALYEGAVFDSSCDRLGRCVHDTDCPFAQECRVPAPGTTTTRRVNA